ncbi:MAG: ABC transporter ATP-binding protein [Acidimicrobiales bacterium]
MEVDGLRVRLGDSQVLHGVSFSVPPGRVTALLGRNGVGKTTTLRAVLGLVPRQGRVMVDGVDVSAEPTHAVVRRGIGYVPEDREVFSRLTVAENLKLAERGPGARYGLVEELFPELATRRRQRAGTLSGGQQQMVALARALLNDNRLLLVDEPTKGLAPRVVAEVAEVLERATATTTVLLVEQDLAVVRRLAVDVVVMAHGQVVHTGPARSLLDDPELTRELLGVARARPPALHSPPAAPDSPAAGGCRP